MSTLSSQVDDINALVDGLKNLGIVHLNADEKREPGWKYLSVDGKKLLNFACCNYLGLETDPRLREAAKEAIDHYGVQFYTVRAYVSLPPYQELEHLFSQMYGKPAVVMPSTALGHWATMPAIVGSEDAVILDHQVHATVHGIARMIKANGVHIEMIRHNRMDYLENRIQKLSLQYKKIWYMADGVYSMYGDIAPMQDIVSLLDKYEQFHLYIDDAHGMSWAGKHGAGMVIERAPFHERMVLMTSLSKAFGTMGGLAVFPNEEMKNLVRNVGSTLIFTGPIQPALLAASLASVKIHLSDEIYQLQSALKSRIAFFRAKCTELDLPVLGEGESPVFYLATGKKQISASLSKKLIEAGFLTALAVFPSVPHTRSGLRLLPTVNHTFEDITTLLETIAELFPIVLEEENFSKEEILESFKLNHLTESF